MMTQTSSITLPINLYNQAKQMEQILQRNIIPRLFRQNRISELMALRQVNTTINATITSLMVTKMGNVLGMKLTWPIAKLVIILKSPAQLQRAGGELFFAGKELIVAECVAQWLELDFLKATSGDLFSWNPEMALWINMEDSSECTFRSALKILISSSKGMVTDQDHLKALKGFFKAYDGSVKFKALFKDLCKVKPQLMQQSHKIAIKHKMILDVKERKIRQRTRNDYCCYELPIEQETAQRALDSNSVTELIEQEKLKDCGTMHHNCEPGGKVDPVFDIFMEQVTCGEVDLKYHLQRLLGRLFAGDINAKKQLFIWHGAANSGKTTLGEIILELFTPYMKVVSEKAVLGNKGAVHDSELIACGGFASALYLDECADNYLLKRALVNRLLGASSVLGRHAGSPTMQEVTLRKYLLLAVNKLPTDMDPDTLAKSQIIPFECQFVTKASDVDSKCHRYKANGSFKEDFLSNNENRQDVYLFVLIGALDYWLNRDAIFNDVPAIVAQAASVRYGKKDNAKRVYSSLVTEFAANYLNLDSEPDIDDFTPTETLYAEFQRQSSNRKVSSGEFGKTLKSILGSKYHCTNARWTYTDQVDSKGPKQKRGFLVTIKKQKDNHAEGDGFVFDELIQTCPSTKKQKLDNQPHAGEIEWNHQFDENQRMSMAPDEWANHFEQEEAEQVYHEQQVQKQDDHHDQSSSRNQSSSKISHLKFKKI